MKLTQLLTADMLNIDKKLPCHPYVANVLYGFILPYMQYLDINLEENIEDEINNE